MTIQTHGFAATANVEVKPTNQPDAYRIAFQQLTRLFQDCCYGDLHRVRVVLHGSVVQLLGDVSSYHMKQTAQEMVRRAMPSHRVINDLTVQSPDPVTTIGKLRNQRMPQQPR
ncbi:MULTISPECIES: BON domain-containing protein [Crateriforma]|uniref:BON domain protein n=1 Tax=Crateriforma conspicua TaxID=2527996 RepID=A0A5C6FRM8_9PLAN|nr:MULTISPECIES: BON domain-containing protein [Crateriforma]TWU65822.1 hypothetical protein V7x_13750 [Crateriforma conspicua]